MSEILSAYQSGQIPERLVFAASLAGDSAATEFVMATYENELPELMHVEIDAEDDHRNHSLTAWVWALGDLDIRLAAVVGLEVARLAGIRYFSLESNVDSLEQRKIELADNYGHEFEASSAIVDWLVFCGDELKNASVRGNCEKAHVNKAELAVAKYFDWCEAIRWSDMDGLLNCIGSATDALLEFAPRELRSDPGADSPRNFQGQEGATAAVNWLINDPESVSSSHFSADELQVALKTAVLEFIGRLVQQNSGPKKFTIREKFAVDDMIEHKKFGVGQVLQATATEIVVKFEDQERKLAHNR